jgi:hypothetical protein
VENVKMEWVEFLEGDIDFLMHTHIWEVNIVRIYTYGECERERNPNAMPNYAPNTHFTQKYCFSFSHPNFNNEEKFLFFNFHPFFANSRNSFPPQSLLHARIILSFFALTLSNESEMMV